VRSGRGRDRASRSGWVRVHAARVDLDGARVLVVGASGTGKTTLAARLPLAVTTRPGTVTCTSVDVGVVLRALLTDALPLTEAKAAMVSVLAGAMVSARGRLTSGRPT
jgi:ABC-type branched-subunit amino acid transport system ATPase component